MSIKLEEFLAELIVRVRNDNLSDDMTKSLTDLFLLNEFEKMSKRQIVKENTMKYYIMGWYVYNMAKTEPQQEKINTQS